MTRFHVPKPAKFWIYISGPYTKDDPVINTRTAINAASLIMNAGHIPIVPHLSLLWHLIDHRPWQEWINYDLELIAKCDLLLRLPGESKGADIEVQHASNLGITVIFSDAAGINWSALCK